MIRSRNLKIASDGRKKQSEIIDNPVHDLI